MSQRLFTSNEHGKIAYQKMGSGPVLVLVHGFPENGDLWKMVAEELSRSFKLIIPDLPGAGESDLPAATLTMELMALSVKAVLEAERIERAVVAGHSMGGYTAMAMAELFPEKISGISLVHSSSFADDEAKKETRRKSIALMEKDGGKEAFIRQMVPSLFSEAFKKSHPDVIERQIARALELPTKAMTSFYNSMILRPDRTKLLPDMAFPWQWIVGEEDKAVPPSASLQQSTKPDVSFIRLYNDCAHMAMLEQPAKLCGDLEAFTLYCNNRNLDNR